MNLKLARFNVGHVSIAAKNVHNADAWEGIRKHLNGDWGEASGNEKFNNDQNVWRHKECVISRHRDRNGVRFIIVTDFTRHTTTLTTEPGT